MRHVLLLRGINLGPRNRISMPELRRAFEVSGYDGVATYLQSGNVVVSSDASPDELSHAAERLITESFGLEIAVVVRTGDELADVVARNPLKDVAADPKRYLVAFLSKAPDPAAVERVAGVSVGDERMAVHGREAYAWIPTGVARSKLWTQLATGGLGVLATSRNWTTVTKLLELVQG